MKPPARLFHFSYHKCLTVYLQKVMKVTFAKPSVKGVDTQYVHLNSRIDRFDEARRTHVMVSVNNHLPDLDALGGRSLRLGLRERHPFRGATVVATAAPPAHEEEEHQQDEHTDEEPGHRPHTGLAVDLRRRGCEFGRAGLVAPREQRSLR